MITVTDKARETLKELLLSNSDDPEISLRLVANPPGQFGLALDREAEGDQVVEQEGTKVLLIGHELANIADGKTLLTARNYLYLSKRQAHEQDCDVL